RPLAFVLDTVCEPLVSYLQHLAERTACRVLRPDATLGGGLAPAMDLSLEERRLRAIGRQIVSQSLDFGIWVSGDGEACHVVGRRGTIITAERLLAVVAGYVCRQRAAGGVLLERETSTQLAGQLSALGISVNRCDGSRQAMRSGMDAHAALVGGGPSG